MTKEEAITKLHWLKAELIKGTDLNEPIDMAIEALQTIDNCDQCEWCCPSDGTPTLHVVRCKDCKHQEECEQIVVFDIHVDEVQGHRVDYCSYGNNDEPKYHVPLRVVRQNIKNAPSAEAVQGWMIDKPSKQGKYMITLDAWGHRYIDIMHYGKPVLPSRKVKGMCWYRTDDEWGDVVYEDEDILAWMPLPEPYREDGDK